LPSSSRPKRRWHRCGLKTNAPLVLGGKTHRSEAVSCARPLGRF
jgi:hypothetical protein